MAATTSPAANSAAATTSSSALHTKNLTFEKKNTNLLHIPGNYRIQKRPIPHSPVASPYAGSTVAKVVYVSSKTPFMSAVKRVQKLLRLAERRAMTPVTDGKQQRKKQQQQGGRSGATAEKVLEQCQQRLRQDKVLVKATGRAIEKALAVGRWFEESKSKGAAAATGDEYEVVVSTGSVCVVDDIEENEDDTNTLMMDEEDDDDKDKDNTGTTTVASTDNNNNNNDIDTKEPTTEATEEENLSKNQRRRRRKRERVQQQRLNAFKDEDGEPPESRTRWVNMVEIAINLK